MTTLRRVALGLLPALLLTSPARGDPPPDRFARPFHVIAHRGASGHAPENTVAAVRLAREMGAFEVELDTQVSRDGVVVLFHDRDLAEKTPLRGRVADHDAERLTGIDMGRWFDAAHPQAPRRYAGERLPTLAGVFETFGAALHYHLELKDPAPGAVAAVVQTVRRHGMEARVTLTSSHFEALETARRLAPELGSCLLIGDREELAEDAAQRGAASGDLLAWQEHWVGRAAAAGFGTVSMPSEDLSAAIVAAARGRGLETRAYRIKDTALMRRAIELGVNGMTINWPDRLIRALLESMARAPGAQAASD